MNRWLARILAALVVALGLVPLTAGASWACSCASPAFTETQQWRSVACMAERASSCTLRCSLC